MGTSGLSHHQGHIYGHHGFWGTWGAENPSLACSRREDKAPGPGPRLPLQPQTPHTSLITLQPAHTWLGATRGLSLLGMSRPECLCRGGDQALDKRRLRGPEIPSAILCRHIPPPGTMPGTPRVLGIYLRNEGPAAWPQDAELGSMMKVPEVSSLQKQDHLPGKPGWAVPKEHSWTPHCAPSTGLSPTCQASHLILSTALKHKDDFF